MANIKAMKSLYRTVSVVLKVGRKSDPGITDGLREYDGQCRKIDSVNFVSDGKTIRHYFTLKGVVSDKGIPYAISEDWIREARS